MKKFLKKGPKNSSSGSDERSESEEESKTSPSGSPHKNKSYSKTDRSAHRPLDNSNGHVVEEQ